MKELDSKINSLAKEIEGMTEHGEITKIEITWLDGRVVGINLESRREVFIDSNAVFKELNAVFKGLNDE